MIAQQRAPDAHHRRIARFNQADEGSRRAPSSPPRAVSTHWQDQNKMYRSTVANESNIFLLLITRETDKIHRSVEGARRLIQPKRRSAHHASLMPTPFCREGWMAGRPPAPRARMISRRDAIGFLAGPAVTPSAQSMMMPCQRIFHGGSSLINAVPLPCSRSPTTTPDHGGFGRPIPAQSVQPQQTDDLAGARALE